MWNSKYLSILFAALLVLSACSKTSSDTAAEVADSDRDRLVYASESEFAGLNPLLEETNVDALLFRGLLRFDENNTPQNDIAQQVEVSEDLLTYTFTLKEDVHFHDGTILSADDVIFTIESILDDQNASFLKSDFIAVDTLTKNTQNQVVITLKYPFTPFLDKMTVPILPKHAFKGETMRNSEFNRSPIGAGPYQMDEWNSGDHIVLKAFPEFFGTAPSIDQVVFKFIEDSTMRALKLKTGEVDVALLDPSQVKSVSGEESIKIYDMDSADYRGMLFNMKQELFQDVNVRKAFSYATDRDSILKGILFGFGQIAYSPLQKNSFKSSDAEPYTYDVKKANKLLEKAGWKKESDGFRYKGKEKLAFTITTPITDNVRVDMANYLSESFKEVGADVKVAALDWSAIVIEETDAFMVGWGSPYDADHHTYALFHSDEASVNSSGYNYGSYSNETVDSLLTEGRKTVDEEKRKEIYGLLQAELSEDPPFIYIAYLHAVYGMNKDIKGVKERTLGHHGSGFLWNVEEWEWNDR
ncbi:ABC transporter substrate-binding protein [Sporosarcina cascadiensis]|uniref:ABC transporter substrate-binding protein n=1 Tax=Sporosarcina cascadiensis TaxID=2660747 RepID=UPI00129B8A33|nr:ABC transporter substrate-binding protein [Sporosarcina cascadiensis]